MNVKRFSIRAARKVAIYGNKFLTKGSRFSEKVERKATRILDGVDFSMKVEPFVPFEKIYYNTLPEVIPVHPSMPAVGSQPTVTLLLPTLDGNSFFGGTATALVVAAKIALKQNRQLRIVQTLKTGSPDHLEGFFEREGIAFPEDRIKVISVADRAYNRYGYISMHPDDIFIASAWWDAKILSQLPLKNKFIYLIQDFEPIFYNNSDSYVLAEETYRGDNFIPLCNTKLMQEFMIAKGYPAFKSKSFYFEPAVSRINSGTVAKKTNSEKRRLFLYGRPNVHRNLFFTALQSIQNTLYYGKLDPNEWEFYMAGQDHLPNVKLPSGVEVKNLGKMSVEEYIEFSKSIDVAVSPMMAPHPNYPTLEFASVGAAVVTTNYENKQDLSNYSNNIVVCGTSIESIADGIVKASKIKFADRVKNAQDSSIPSDWNKSLDDSINGVLSHY